MPGRVDSGGKDVILRSAEAVFEALTDLNHQDIAARTPLFDGLTNSIDRMSGKLDTLRARIDDLVHQVKVADQVAAAIDKAASAAAGFFV